MKKILLLSLALVLLLCTPLVAAPQAFEWLPGGEYDATIPVPRDVLGYEIGTFLTDHLQMVDYMHRLAQSTDRVQITQYGQSVERRNMYLLFIGSPENLARLETIREQVARLKDPRTLSAEEADQIIANTPPIGWVNFGTDGGETAAFEAAMQLAYQLAAGRDPLTQKITSNIVTIINPVACPDSHQAFASWMKAATIGPAGTADPQAAEHSVPWHISSDGNHYLIDFNRDAFALTQPEARALSKVLQHWNPQVWVDNHGEPNEYYFAPFAVPMNLNYPTSLKDRATDIGRNTARYFDRFGWSYAKDETYDLYYPGYWDSYPAFNGAVSATYETNGGGWKNLAWEKPDGTIATLQNATHAHFTADMATLETLADNGPKFLRYFYDFYRTGMEEAEKGEVKSYVLLPTPDPGRTDDLVRTLLNHGIEVFQTTESMRSSQARTYFERSPREIEFPAGSYVIPVKQPRKRFLQTMFEPDPVLEQRFLDDIAAARERNAKLGTAVPKERAGFYDITAWTFPLMFGIDCAFTPEALPLSQAQRVASPLAMNSRSPEKNAAYAYLFANDRDANLKLAGKLLQEHYRVAMSTQAFSNGGIDYPAGTFVARIERNEVSLHARIRELAEKYGSHVRSIDSAWSDSGPSLGSRTVVDLVTPRVAVLSNDPTRAVTFGSVYALLEQRFDLTFTSLVTAEVSGFDLSRYNVIILPDGSAGGYKRTLGNAGIEKLKAWVESGGVLIGIKGGAEFTTLEGVALADTAPVTTVKGADTGDNNDREAEEEPIEYHPGSIFRAEVNTDYFLGFGCNRTIAVQVRGNTFLSKSARGANVVSFPADSFLAGHKWENSERALEGNVYMADIPVDEGHVVLFADDPTFRAYWNGLDRLLLNAVLLGPGF